MVAKVEQEGEEATYGYDFNNRLTKVVVITEDGTRTVEYTYDGLGNRILRKETNPDGEVKETRYINDVSQPLTQVLQETDDRGKVKDSYVYGLDLISRVDKKNKPDYYLYDGLGSVVGLTNSKGALTTKYSYDEWGVPDHHSRFGQGGKRSNTYGFTGENYDQDIGLLYLRARYYMPETGRFTSRDPLSGNTALPQSINRYLYCWNSPQNFIDPSGLGAKRGPTLVNIGLDVGALGFDIAAYFLAEHPVTYGIAYSGGVVCSTANSIYTTYQYLEGKAMWYDVTVSWGTTVVGLHPATAIPCDVIILGYDVTRRYIGP